MKFIYTATFVPNEDATKFYCRVPDLPGCITTGDNLEDAIEMITDAASGWLVVAEDEGNEIPKVTSQRDLDIPRLYFGWEAWGVGGGLGPPTPPRGLGGGKGGGVWYC